MLASGVTTQAGVIVNELIELAEELAREGNAPSALNLLLQQVVPALDATGAYHEAAGAIGRIADILESQGRTEAALALWREQVLPRTGGIPQLQVEATQRLAELYAAKGDYDEAIRLRCEEILPLCQEIEDTESFAMNLAYLAETLFQAGRLDESLECWTENVLPTYMEMGDDATCALACGKIADIHQARGEHHEALRIRLHEQIPTYEELGDLESLVVARTNLAINLIARDAEGDYDNARIILEAALSDAEEEGLAPADDIRAFMMKRGFLSESVEE